ncbi:MAG: hypothetical protein ABSH38_21260 [Verrucomicrobiota bacterium]|jgi:hypothetical protein
MQPNKDQIARPAKGRFFAHTVPEILSLLGELGFSHSPYRKRLDVVFKNPKHESGRGTQVVSLYKADAIIIYSFEERFGPIHAKAAVVAALEHLAVLDRKENHEWSRRESVSFRAYLGELGKLTITRHIRIATLGKYRGNDRFSNACKPISVRSEERVVCAIELA